MKELRAASFQTRDIARLVRDKDIEKVKPGLYKLSEIVASGDINPSLVEISHAVPRGVIALVSALAHYELTTFVPPKITYPPVRFFYYPERFYNAGIEKIKTPAGIVRMYGIEKTICDVFRYRN